MAGGQEVRLRHLLRDPRDRRQKLPCIALLLGRGEERQALPSEEEILRSGDRLVFAGVTWSHSRMGWTLQNQVALTYVTTGRALPQSYVWRWIVKAFAHSTAKVH